MDEIRNSVRELNEYKASGKNRATLKLPIWCKWYSSEKIDDIIQ